MSTMDNEVRLLWWDDASYIRYQADPGEGPEDIEPGEPAVLPPTPPRDTDIPF